MLVMQNHIKTPNYPQTYNPTNVYKHMNTHIDTDIYVSAHSVGAGAGEVYGHRTRGRAVVRQEVIKAVKVSGGA